MRTTRRLICALATAAWTAAFAASPSSPPTIKTLIDNDKVAVTEIRYKPGQGLDMAERGAHVVRALTNGTMDFIPRVGTKRTVQWKAGDVLYFPKETFATQNVGREEAAFFLTTLK